MIISFLYIPRSHVTNAFLLVPGKTRSFPRMIRFKPGSVGAVAGLLVAVRLYRTKHSSIGVYGGYGSVSFTTKESALLPLVSCFLPLSLFERFSFAAIGILPLTLLLLLLRRRVV